MLRPVPVQVSLLTLGPNIRGDFCWQHSDPLVPGCFPRLSLFSPGKPSRTSSELCGARNPQPRAPLPAAPAGARTRTGSPSPDAWKRREEEAALLNRGSPPALGSTPGRSGCPRVAWEWDLGGEGIPIPSPGAAFDGPTPSPSAHLAEGSPVPLGLPSRRPPAIRERGREAGAGRAAGPRSRGSWGSWGIRGSPTFPWPRRRGPAAGGS